MQLLCDYSRVFWCPRCGTIKTPGEPKFTEPKIVQCAFTLCEAALGTIDNPQALEIAERNVRECVESNAEGV